MKLKTAFIILPLMSAVSHGADFFHLGANSISISAPSLVNYDDLAALVTYKSGSSGNLTVDSVTIRFLSGDSADFSMGKNCQPGQFYQYNYDGWIYGVSSWSLRYSKDSLFVLQDSAGKPVTFTVFPYDTLEFGIYQITNCPICGRLPSFPKTTAYQYVLHYTGGADTLKVIVGGSTSMRSSRAALRVSVPQTSSKAALSIDGRKLHNGTMRCSGIVADENSGRHLFLYRR